MQYREDAGNLPVMLAIAVIVGLLGFSIPRIDALIDYITFIVEFAGEQSGIRIISQALLTTLLYVLFSVLYFDIVVPTSLSQRAATLPIARAADLFARLIIVLTPTLVLAYIFVQVLRSSGASWVTVFSIGVFAASVIVHIVATVLRHPVGRLNKPGKLSGAINRGGSPLSLLARHVIPVALIAALALYAWLLLDVIGAARFIGGLGVIFLFLVFVFCFLHVLFAHRRIMAAIAGWSALAILIANAVPFGYAKREFRLLSSSSGDRAAGSKPETVEETLKHRQISSVAAAFAQWLENRPSFARADSTKAKYPVFIVAAQGGGQYAAYHTAVVLARLYDQCPKLKDHVFAISSVSGGSVGAAVIGELLRTSGSIVDSCDVAARNDGALERSVQHFFSHDFVTPVLANGLLFDLPGLLVPQMRPTRDRAVALELALERAWEDLPVTLKAGGMSRNFYGVWSPTGHAPALFMNTTGANYGLPILVSELYMAEPPKNDLIKSIFGNLRLRIFGSWDKVDLGSVFTRGQGNLETPEATLRTREAKTRELDERLQSAINEAVRTNAYTRPSYFNILDYRPEIQINLSTAAILSARFPFVTPSGLLDKGDTSKSPDDTLRQTESLQLIDGGFWDNSGAATAIEIIQRLQSSEMTKDLLGRVEFHLIMFGHAKSVLRRSGTQGAQNEALTPIATFEAVRQARRLQERDATARGFKSVHVIELFDHEFQAPLTWTLSQSLRKKIEARSGGGAVPTLCCRLNLPRPFGPIFDDIVVDLGTLGPELAMMDAVSGFHSTVTAEPK